MANPKPSAAILIADVNDYINPGTSCIKPTPPPPKKSEYSVSKEGEEPKKRAEINLNDCLACSGCITSAETVLITMQSQEEIYRFINSNLEQIKAGQLDKVKDLVVSISPQSRASFAAKFDCSPLQAMKRLTWFFSSHIAKRASTETCETRVIVIDTSFARDFALEETAKEFLERFKSSTNLPLLSSACPGWICYAEKTQGKDILPFISTARSPQQVMGVLLKQLCELKEDREAYHLSIMPCFDKKLEASREEFTQGEAKDVDCVLSTVELERLIFDEGLDFRDLLEAPLNPRLSKVRIDENGVEHLQGTSGSTSGGYLDYTLKYASKHLFVSQDVRIETADGKNPDLKEYILYVNDKPHLRFAAAYGFRNIQNIVRKLKPSKTLRKKKDELSSLPLHFVEIMACPSGCINGGGQLKPDTEEEVVPVGIMKEFVQKMTKVYNSVTEHASNDLELQRIYSKLTHGQLHTSYKVVEEGNSNVSTGW